MLCSKNIKINMRDFLVWAILMISKLWFSSSSTSIYFVPCLEQIYTSIIVFFRLFFPPATHYVTTHLVHKRLSLLAGVMLETPLECSLFYLFPLFVFPLSKGQNVSWTLTSAPLLPARMGPLALTSLVITTASVWLHLKVKGTEGVK